MGLLAGSLANKDSSGVRAQGPSGTRPFQSISRRFSYAFIGVVTMILVAFAAAGVLLNMARIDSEIRGRLDNAVKMAQIALPIPLWDLDNEVVEDFLATLFLDESLALAQVSWGGNTLTQRVRPAYREKEISDFEDASDFIVKSADIEFQGGVLGSIVVVVSREAIRKQAIAQVSAIVALTLLIIVAIFLTSVVITRRYISHPLTRLQASAALIAKGELGAAIDTGSKDEIGRLARDLDAMRGSIKELFGALREANETLEQKVNERTAQLERSVRELTALGEVSQVVNSSLEVETVLTSIVAHAVQLSSADDGTIYELDEDEKIFVPRASYGIDDELVEALRDSRLQVGDGTVVGRAAASRAPEQVADLVTATERHLEQVRVAGYRALLAVPMVGDRRVIGMLVIRRMQAGEFRQAVVKLVETFAAQSVGAILNARLFREIQEKSRELAVASRHKSQFLASVSHELRTPLNSIIGFSEVLLEKMCGALNAKQEEYLTDIATSGRHLLNLINDILDLSKIEAGKMELELRRVDLRALLEGSAIVVKERALAHGIRLSLELADEIDTIVADERKVKQIMFNLLSNAVKFTPDNGEVGIRAKQSRGLVEIAIWDTGIGISSEDQERIFEEFQQIGSGLTGKPEGTGLGLALSRRLIELHGGEIRVDSALDHGSTFTFTLPATLDSSATAPGPEAGEQLADTELSGRQGRSAVLVVEDDVKNRKLVCELLRYKGYETLEVETAEAGLAVARQRRPALILMDIQLPGMDGRSAMKALKEHEATREIPVIALTASAMRGDREALLAEGFDGYVAKPIDIKELPKILEGYLGQR